MEVILMIVSITSIIALACSMAALGYSVVMRKYVLELESENARLKMRDVYKNRREFYVD